MPEPHWSVADELTKLAGLRDQGVITEAEFDAQKAQLLGETVAGAPPEGQHEQRPEPEPVEEPTIAGMPPRNEGSLGVIALVAAVLIPIAGIILGAIGLKKSRTQRDKVLSGIALGFGIAWVVGGGVIALVLLSSGGSHFVKQTPLEQALTSQTATSLAASRAGKPDKVAQFRCAGPVKATTSQQAWTCTSVVSTGTFHQAVNLPVAGKSDGSWTADTAQLVGATYRLQYLRLVTPMNSALDVLSRKLQKLTTASPTSDFVTASTPFSKAVQKFDSDILRAEWPTGVTADIHSLATSDGPLVADLNSAWHVNSLTALDWSSSLTSDLTKSSLAANIVRSDLGLPPPS